MHSVATLVGWLLVGWSRKCIAAKRLSDTGVDLGVSANVTPSYTSVGNSNVKEKNRQILLQRHLANVCILIAVSVPPPGELTCKNFAKFL